MKPETQAIAITRKDGGLSIMRFVTRGMLNQTEVFEREATAEAVEAEITKSGIDAARWRLIEEGDIPHDRTFRDAWADTGKVDVDMPKAREIHKNNLRDIRAPLLAALDVDYQRADERGNKASKATIAARKQALRDVTTDPAIEAATTPEALKNVLPEALR